MKKDILFHDETLFKNPDVFNFDYIPEQFSFRGNQVQEIVNCLKPGINNKRPVNCMLAGNPATGKTTSIKKIFEEIEEHNNIMPVYINSRISNTTFRVYCEISKVLLGYRPPDSGIPIASLYQKIFKKLCENKKIPIIALDDSVFLEDPDEVIYQLLRASELYPGVKLGIIAVLSEKEKYLIEDKSVSVFYPRIIKFPNYNENEIYDILNKRVDLGLYENVISTDLIKKIAEKAANIDLRLGIELLRQSAIEAEIKEKKSISEQDIESAFSKILKSDKSLKSELNNIEKNIIKLLHNQEYNSGELYKELCKKIELSYSGFYRAIKKLSKDKLIDVREKAEKKGRTRVIKRL